MHKATARTSVLCEMCTFLYHAWPAPPIVYSCVVKVANTETKLRRVFVM